MLGNEWAENLKVQVLKLFNLSLRKIFRGQKPTFMLTLVTPLRFDFWQLLILASSTVNASNTTRRGSQYYEDYYMVNGSFFCN